MNQKTFLWVVASVFLLVLILHAARVMFGWEAVVATVRIPLWVSWLAVFLAGALCAEAYTLAKTRHRSLLQRLFRR